MVEHLRLACLRIGHLEQENMEKDDLISTLNKEKEAMKVIFNFLFNFSVGLVYYCLYTINTITNKVSARAC